MSYSEDEYLMISGIQHFVFCRRQWALIHIDEVWAENWLTAEGELTHKNAHNPDFIEKRHGVLVTRDLRVSSPTLGVSGQCDVVEFIRLEQGQDGAILRGHRGTWKVVPIEYKRGKDKEDHSDMLQLCCESMCLEEMLACQIPVGYLYYHALRRRREIPLTPDLRDEVRKALLEMHSDFKRKHIPKVRTSRKCQSCSLKDFCLPKLQKQNSVSAYYSHVLGEDV